MTNLKISNRQPAGSDFFSDSESYIMDLSEEELNTTSGGSFSVLVDILIAVTHTSIIAQNTHPDQHNQEDRGPVSFIP